MPRQRDRVHSKLKLEAKPVIFSDGTTGIANREGNNDAWHCQCEGSPLLTGR